MERTISIYHEGAMAHYNVAKQDNGTFKARLLQYSGNRSNTPPQVIELQKQGSHWNQSENTYDYLIEGLGSCIDLQRAIFQ